MASDNWNLTTDLLQLVHTVGHRNRAGAPLVAAKAPYDVDLALRLVTAAQEVIQRVASDPSRPTTLPTAGSSGSSRAGSLAVVAGGRAAHRIDRPAARAATPVPTNKPQP